MGRRALTEHYKATDIVEQALSGLMFIFGSSDREPLAYALHQAQFNAGANAATAAAIALFHQQLTGLGQWVDVSVQECIASGLRDTTSLYSYTGAIKGRRPAYSGDIPRSPMKAKDGYVVPVSLVGVDWETSAGFLDSPELRESRFGTLKGRADNALELDEIVERSFGDREKLEVFYASHQRKGLVYGVVQSPQEVVENPQYHGRGYFVEAEHATAGKAIYPGAPFVMGETPWTARSAAPTLGQHNREILCGRLGYTTQDLVTLHSSGVI